MRTGLKEADIKRQLMQSSLLKVEVVRDLDDDPSPKDIIFGKRTFQFGEPGREKKIFKKYFPRTWPVPHVGLPVPRPTQCVRGA